MTTLKPIPHHYQSYKVVYLCVLHVAKLIIQQGGTNIYCTLPLYHGTYIFTYSHEVTYSHFIHDMCTRIHIHIHEYIHIHTCSHTCSRFSCTKVRTYVCMYMYIIQHTCTIPGYVRMYVPSHIIFPHIVIPSYACAHIHTSDKYLAGG